MKVTYEQVADDFMMQSWPTVRMTRRGLRNYLKVCLSTRWYEPFNKKDPDAIYRLNEQIAEVALRLYHVRFPQEWADRDRWKARFYVLQGYSASPSTARWINQLYRRTA